MTLNIIIKPYNIIQLHCSIHINLSTLLIAIKIVTLSHQYSDGICLG